MNKALVGTEFDIVKYYSISLTTIFMTLLYSSGIPILLWIGAIGLTIQYW